MRLDLDRAKSTTLHVSAEDLGRLVADAPSHNVAAFLQGMIPTLMGRSDLEAITNRVTFLSLTHRKAFEDFASDLASRKATWSDFARAIEDSE